jgi:4a-hydroxytetrahydrobiopterin dehydratase
VTDPALADRKCVPCHGGTPRLDERAARELLAQLETGWSIDPASGHLERTFRHADFASALAFANAAGAVAEAAGHHPDLHVGWGRCRVEIWTHAISGLSEMDFVLAARIDRLAR